MNSFDKCDKSLAYSNTEKQLYRAIHNDLSARKKICELTDFERSMLKVAMDLNFFYINHDGEILSRVSIEKHNELYSN